MHSRMASKIELWPLDRLRPYEKNARTHDDDQVEQIAASIVEFGFNNPVLVDSDDGIVAGHGRLLAAKKLDLDQVPVVVLDHLTDAQRRAYVIADNKLAEQAGWDEAVLAGEVAALQDEDFDLGVIGFTDEELADLLDGLGDDAGLAADGDLPELPAEPVPRSADLWHLGDHRVLCGDATCAQDVSRLAGGQAAAMAFCDPPYNIDYGNIKHPKFKMRDIQNDNLDADEFRQFCRQWAAQIREHVTGCVYVCGPPGPDGRTMFAELDNALHCSTTVIWNKDVFTLGRSKYQNKHEPIWFGWNTTGKRFTGNRTLTNVWDFDRPKRSDLHPTMKPVELVATAISHASRRGDIVLDLFGGSGSTLIACEKTQRKAQLLEIDPKYIDVIVTRWQEYAGQQAILDGQDKTFAEVFTERQA